MGEHLNPKRAADIHRLSRTEVKTLTEVFIGHGNHACHRHKIGLSESPLSRLCGEDNETSIHILCYCPAIRDKRQTLTGYFFIDVAVIQTKSIAQVLALWHGLLGRAEGFQSSEKKLFCLLTPFEWIMKFNNFDPHIMPVMVAATILRESSKLPEVATPLI